jgi:hypothetical protein
VAGGGEMTQTLYAHMNKRNFKKRKDKQTKQNKEQQMLGRMDIKELLHCC